MRHRIFVAIGLPEDIRNKLAGYEAKYPDLPAKWTRADNLHITLVFLGYVEDEELLEISRITKEVAKRSSGFQVRLNKVSYGPPDKPARMVWVAGEKSQEFSALRSDLEESFLQSEKVRLSKEEKAFSVHITLARIKQWEWRQIEPEERPEINEDIDFVFDVETIEIMESELKRGGPKYTILESHNLGNDL